MLYQVCYDSKVQPMGLIRAELQLLQRRWHIILLGLAFQYVHGIFTQLAYRMHHPAPQPLHDVGFSLIPELPAGARWVSEAIFTVLLLSFIGWSFTPLLVRRRFSTVLLWTRLLTVLVVCQFLRILTFTSTQLPGPAPHCRAGTATALLPAARVWWQHVVVDVRTQVARSCGDLIFSSHMTFILTGILAYTHYGTKPLVKAAAWAAGAVLAVLIIAARKHYTVDVVIAWYTVPMVYTLLHTYWGQQNSSSSSSRICSGSTCSSCGRSTNAYIGQLQKPAAAAAPAGEDCSCCSTEQLQLQLPVSCRADPVGVGSSGSTECYADSAVAGAAEAGVGSAPLWRPGLLWWLFRDAVGQRRQQQQLKGEDYIEADIEAQVLLPRWDKETELSGCLSKL